MAVFHLIPLAEWELVRQGSVYAPASLATVGFIHFSHDRQLLETAARFFAGRPDLIVLSVRTDRLQAELREERVDGELFPHLYGPLNLDAVVEAVPLPLRPDGTFDVPEAFRPWRAYFERGR